MVLDRVLRDEEMIADLAARVSLSHQLKNFNLPPGEGRTTAGRQLAVAKHLLDHGEQLGSHQRGDNCSVLDNIGNGRRQRRERCVLDDIPAGSCLDAGEQVVLGLADGEEDDLGAGRGRQQLVDYLEA
jgi:hypothetical protein